MTREFTDDINPELWSRAWTAESCAQQQHQAASKELQKWLNGMPHAAFDAFVELMSRCRAQPQSLLEVGCGAGYYQQVVQRVIPDCLYFGVDFSAAMIAVAAAEYPEGSFLSRTAEQLGFAPGSFDCVVLGSVLGCCDNWEQALREAVMVSYKYIMLHRVAVHANPDLPDIRNSVKTAYDVVMAERIIRESVLLDFVKGLGCVQVGDPVTWSVSDDGFQASYLFEKSHDSIHHDV